MKNFITRALTAIVIVAVQVLCTYLHPLSLAGLFLIFTALTVNEFLGILTQKGAAQVNRSIIVAASCYLFFAFWLNSLNQGESLIVFAPYLLFLLYCYTKELYGKHSNPIANLGTIMLSQMYIVLPLSLINVLAFKDFECFSGETMFYSIPLAIYIFIWVSDTGAYLCGVTMGKHRLFPRISPKKSWEGSIGGAILTLACAFAIAQIAPFMNVWQWMGMALVVVVAGTYGDLVESMIKRHLGIKDSGNMLPGHGGILDRLDSMLFSIPAVVVYLLLLSMYSGQP